MNDTFDFARLHQEELDREIEAIQTERLVRSATPVRQGLPTRARAGLGRVLISLGTALVGRADAAAAAARSAGSQSRV
jgi:hypothetical protein